MVSRFVCQMLAATALMIFAVSAQANEFLEPWKDKSKAIIIDAYEFNPINWFQLLKDKRIAGFIAKASDGLPPKYGCKGNEKSYEFRYCRVAWRKYSVAKELYQTRRMIAKGAGLKWGGYHLGRAGNPIKQADHFIEFAEPTADEMIVIDVEDINNKEFISLEDAEIFAKRIYQRLGRYPVLYINHQTMKWIALKRKSLPILSRLKVWYARYKGDIRGVFPTGNWFRYLMWQFASGNNCSKKSCPYRVAGTERNIDVNVMNMSVKEVKQKWPFDGLIPARTINREIAYKEDSREFYKLAESKVFEGETIIPDPVLKCLTSGDKLKSFKECPVVSGY